MKLLYFSSIHLLNSVIHSRFAPNEIKLTAGNGENVGKIGKTKIANNPYC